MSAEEPQDYREVVFANTIQSMQSILDAMDSFGLTLSDEQARGHAILLQTLSRDVSATTFDERLREAIVTLLAETAVQETITRRNEYQLNDSALYFFESVHRFVGDYVPSDMDIIKSRVKTTGIVEVYFPDVGGLPIRVLDVGGQRSERKKW